MNEKGNTLNIKTREELHRTFAGVLHNEDFNTSDVIKPGRNCRDNITYMKFKEYDDQQSYDGGL